MKLSCEIIKDLLPLYQEGLCQEETRQLVEEHLKNCPTCTTMLDTTVYDLPATLETNEASAHVLKGVKKSLKRKRIQTAIVSVLVAALVIIPGYHFYLNSYDVRSIVLSDWEHQLARAGGGDSMPFVLNEGVYYLRMYRFEEGKLISTQYSPLETRWNEEWVSGIQIKDNQTLILNVTNTDYATEWSVNLGGAVAFFERENREEFVGGFTSGSIGRNLRLREEEVAIAFSAHFFFDEEGFIRTPAGIEEMIFNADFTQEHLPEFEEIGEVFIVTIERLD